MLGLVVIATMLAACQGAATGNDPYQITYNATKAGWDQVQIDLSLSAQAGSDSINLQPGAVRLVLDTKAGKGLFHLSIPKAALGSSAASLAQLGITGDTIDIDVLYDGQALYAKSPLAPPLLQLVYASSGGTPAGDLTGWLKLATAADIASLAALGGGLAGASPAPMPTVTDANAMKLALTNAGITLAYVATETHNGVSADHVTATIDWAKLAASDAFKSSASQAQVQQGITALQNTNSSIDLWVDHSSGKLIGIEVKGSSRADATQTFDLNITFKAPDAGTSLDAPATSVDVPLMQLLGPMLQQLMGGVTP
ncbi:MAG TPA: hypothetical protein VE011_04785 [Candidatus Dormibacteraeota bacterium]|nr:hypothetical protein [Candidatus Dormibacteraeota bacterium]